ALWAGRRYFKAINDGDYETFAPRKWDRLVLVAMSLLGVGLVPYPLVRGESLLQSPWPEMIAFSAPAWASLVAARKDGPGVLSVETVFLWAFAFASFNVAALETGRSENRGPAMEVASSGSRGPKPVGKLWERSPPSDGTCYATPLAAG